MAMNDENGVNFRMRPFTGAASQVWHFHRVPGTSYYIISSTPLEGEMLTVLRNPALRGQHLELARISQLFASNMFDAHWRVVQHSTGYLEIVNRITGRRLDIDGNNSASGAGVITWPQNNANNQLWRLVH